MICLLRKIIVVMFLIGFTSCNLKKKKDIESQNLKEKTSVEDKTKTKVVDEMIIKIFFKMEASDHIQLYYTNDALENFSEKNTFRKNFSENTDFQLLEFKFDKDYFPEKIRLDLGSNREQKSIIIDKIQITRSKYAIEILGKDIKEYFTVNKYVKNIQGSGEFIFTIVNNIYDPYLTSNKKLNYELEIL